MTAKFPKSNISINGQIDLWIHHPQEGFKLSWNEPKTISISGLNHAKSGVYCLRNKLNGRLYIGMASNLERRRWRHLNDLKSAKHINKLLLQDYAEWLKEQFNLGNINTNPEAIFEFEVIIYCYPSQLTFWENLLITNLNPYYNSKKQKDIVYDDSDKRLLTEYDLEKEL